MSRKVYDAGELVEEWDDSTRTFRRFEDGVLVEERSYADEERAASSIQTNMEILTQAARDGLATNRDFLAMTSPTDAETLAQVRSLTRQMGAVVRLVVGDFTGTD